MRVGDRCRRLVLTCEHASRALPPRWRARFAADSRRLRSHRGWDPGAADVARALARSLGAPLLLGDVTRLLVDLNRSPHNPAVFGAFARELSPAERAWLLERYHAPHWRAVVEAVEAARARGDWVLHVAVHSFAPVVRGERRAFDVGLLYDPRRAPERRLAAEWKTRLASSDPPLRVRRNQPYRGRSDGLPTALRRRFAARDYCGIELELGQALLRDAGRRRRLTGALTTSLFALLDGGEVG